MIGIAIKLRTDSDGDGLVEKTIYLRTRRSGEAGESFKRAKRAARKLEFSLAKCTKQIDTLESRLARVQDDDRAKALSEERDAAMDRFVEIMEQSEDALANVVRLSLAGNYGSQEVDAIMDQFKDSDLPDLVSAIETGETPADFFAGSVQPLTSTSTVPSGESSTESSSGPDGQSTTSSPEKSD